MKQICVFQCEVCGKFFKDEVECQSHEQECLPLEAGQRVEFLFGLAGPFKGEITHIPEVIALAEEPTVNIRADDEIYEPDFSLLQDGHDVWVTRNKVLRVL